MRREWLAEMWQYRELFYFFAWRDVKIRYRQTLLGVAWAMLQPLLTMLVFLVLFGKIAKLPTDGTPHALFYYTALVPWAYFSVTLGMCSNSLISNANLLTKVYFPRTILPASVALSGLVDFCVGSLFIVGLLSYYRICPPWTLLMWPLLAVMLVIFTYGLGMFLAALTVKYRDFKYAVPFCIQLWLFVTPVIYPIELIPERYRWWLALNPLSGLIEAFRDSLLPSKRIDWALLGISTVVTVLVFGLGLLYFKKTEQAFADIV